MLECMIIGDSIAVGVAMHRPECEVHAKVGLSSVQFGTTYADKILEAKTVIISVGSNDHQYVPTNYELLKIRGRISADRVYWIMPQGNAKESNVPIERIQAMVSKIANTMGDGVIHFTPSPDGIHPAAREYRRIAIVATNTEDKENDERDAGKHYRPY